MVCTVLARVMVRLGIGACLVSVCRMWIALMPCGPLLAMALLCGSLSCWIVGGAHLVVILWSDASSCIAVAAHASSRRLRHRFDVLCDLDLWLRFVSRFPPVFPPPFSSFSACFLFPSASLPRSQSPRLVPCPRCRLRASPFAPAADAHDTVHGVSLTEIPSPGRMHCDGASGC